MVISDSVLDPRGHTMIRYRAGQTDAEWAAFCEQFIAEMTAEGWVVQMKTEKHIRVHRA